MTDYFTQKRTLKEVIAISVTLAFPHKIKNYRNQTEYWIYDKNDTNIFRRFNNQTGKLSSYCNESHIKLCENESDWYIDIGVDIIDLVRLAGIGFEET